MRCLSPALVHPSPSLAYLIRLPVHSLRSCGKSNMGSSFVGPTKKVVLCVPLKQPKKDGFHPKKEVDPSKEVMDQSTALFLSLLLGRERENNP